MDFEVCNSWDRGLTPKPEHWRISEPYQRWEVEFQDGSTLWVTGQTAAIEDGAFVSRTTSGMLLQAVAPGWVKVTYIGMND